MFSMCKCQCSICGQEMDFHRRYGRTACCCNRDCWLEFEWRETLSILGKGYYPDPRKVEEAAKKVE